MLLLLLVVVVNEKILLVGCDFWRLMPRSPLTQECRNIPSSSRQASMTTAPRKGIWIDPDFRLFAQIELTAALAGLPEIGGTSVYRNPRAPLHRHHR